MGKEILNQENTVRRWRRFKRKMKLEMYASLEGAETR